MHTALTHDEVMELTEGDMIRVATFVPGETALRRIAFVDSQVSGIVHYHLWTGVEGKATHGDIYTARETT